MNKAQVHVWEAQEHTRKVTIALDDAILQCDDDVLLYELRYTLWTIHTARHHLQNAATHCRELNGKAPADINGEE